jgi:hypothetical protein
MNISGAVGTTSSTSISYTINNITVADAGDYDIVVNGICNPVTSAIGKLMVKELIVTPVSPYPIQVPGGTPIQQYSDLVNIVATIYNGKALKTSDPLASVNFTLSGIALNNSPVALNVVGNNLVASMLNTPLVETPSYPSNGQMVPVNDKPVEASFINISSVSSNCISKAKLTIKKEDVIIDYTGDVLKSTGSSSATSVSVTLRANISDIVDPNTGDIRNAKVMFVDRDNGDAPLSSWIPVDSLVYAGNKTIGTVSKNITLTVGSGGYIFQTVGIKVDGYYYRDNPDDNTVITVYQPTGDFITGGGFIVPTSSIGYKSSDPGKKANFGFNVKFNKTGKNLQGNMNIIFRKTESDGLVHVYQIKANAMQSLGVNASNPNRQTAEYVSKVTLKDLTAPITSDLYTGGNKFLYVKMVDNGEPGRNDSISFVLLTGDYDPTIVSNIIWSSNWVMNRTQMMNLTGGNLLVHSGFNLGSVSNLTLTRQVPSMPVTEVSTFNLKAYPNPSTSQFTVNVQSSNREEKIQVRVMDLNGRVVELFNNLSANQSLQIGANYRPGMYIVEMIQGNERKQLKLIKQPN